MISINNKFTKQNISKQWLFENGFHYNRIFSNEDNEVYTYRFPVLKYEGAVVLECKLKIILGENNVMIDVYNYNTINRYAPFYHSEYGNYEKVLESIWTKIVKVTKKLGIEESRENNEGKNKKDKRKCNDTNKRKR